MDIAQLGITISIVSLSFAVLKNNSKKNGQLTLADADKRYKEIEDKFRQKDMCEKIHQSADEKLDCIPEIKETVTRLETKMNLLINGRIND